MRQAKDRGGQLGPWHWHKVVLDEGELDGVLGQAALQHVHVASLEEPAQEVDRACWREDFFHLGGQELVYWFNSVSILPINLFPFFLFIHPSLL